MGDILVLGMLVSIIFYELTDITPGGIIVPGLMVMYISNPIKMLYTIGIALASYFIVKLMSRRFIIFGKRRFVLFIIVSLFLHFLLNIVFGLFTLDFASVGLSLVGYTVAGIIANNMYKQGVVKTVCSLGVVVGILELLIIMLNSLGVMI